MSVSRSCARPPPGHLRAASARDLFGTPGGGDSWAEQHALPMAGARPVVLTAVFPPLAVRRFQRLSG